MPKGASPPLVIEALLKYPGRIIHELQNNWRSVLLLWLLSLVLLGMMAYGVVVGSFSGGAQLWIAPAKIAMGTILAILICLPSLYIFTCLSGIDAQLRTVTGVLFAAVSLGALLLIGFAPVAWIFSQSTDSVAFMAALHIGLWAIGIMFGLRLLEAMGHLLGRSANPFETLERDFHCRLLADDDDTAPNCRNVRPFFTKRKEILSRALGGNSSGWISKKVTTDFNANLPYLC